MIQCKTISVYNSQSLLYRSASWIFTLDRCHKLSRIKTHQPDSNCHLMPDGQIKHLNNLSESFSGWILNVGYIKK
jgi:hypothetical protein